MGRKLNLATYLLTCWSYASARVLLLLIDVHWDELLMNLRTGYCIQQWKAQSTQTICCRKTKLKPLKKGDESKLSVSLTGWKRRLHYWTEPETLEKYSCCSWFWNRKWNSSRLQIELLPKHQKGYLNKNQTGNLLERTEKSATCLCCYWKCCFRNNTVNYLIIEQLKRLS
jgi:hypothetical protein